jgi:hypothetical protein
MDAKPGSILCIAHIYNHHLFATVSGEFVLYSLFCLSLIFFKVKPFVALVA